MVAAVAGPASPALRAGLRPVADATGLADAPSLTLGFRADRSRRLTSRAMLDRNNLFPIGPAELVALEELVIYEGDELTFDGSHADDFIGFVIEPGMSLDEVRRGIDALPDRPYRDDETM
jgi:hypothetical protein